VFGADAVRYDFDRAKSKLSGKGVRGIFVGVSPDRKGWLILDPKTRKVRTSFHVRFNEDFTNRRDALSGIRLKMKSKVDLSSEVLHWAESFSGETPEAFWLDSDPDFGSGAVPYRLEHDFGSAVDLLKNKAPPASELRSSSSNGEEETHPHDMDLNSPPAPRGGSIVHEGDVRAGSQRPSPSEDQILEGSDGGADDFDHNPPIVPATRLMRSGRSVLTDPEPTREQLSQEGYYLDTALVRDCIPRRDPSLPLGVEDASLVGEKAWLYFALKYDWSVEVEMSNPKLKNSKCRDRYEIYKYANSLQEMYRCGATIEDLLFDYRRGYYKFDTVSMTTVGELKALFVASYGHPDADSEDFNSAYLRINMIETENSVRDEFAEVGLDYLESMNHNQQRLLKQVLAGKTLTEFAHICASNIMFGDPVTVADALAGPHKLEWQAAMDEEIANLIKFNCFDTVSKAEALKTGGRLLQSKWVFKTKMQADGSVQRYRARLVAKGFMMKEGIDVY
jgi:hypothetical protein